MSMYQSKMASSNMRNFINLLLYFVVGKYLMAQCYLCKNIPVPLTQLWSKHWWWDGPSLDLYHDTFLEIDQSWYYLRHTLIFFTLILFVFRWILSKHSMTYSLYTSIGMSPWNTARFLKHCFTSILLMFRQQAYELSNRIKEC